jgi:cytidyltransferase-like protein
MGNVATIGTFDLLHRGHYELFEYCRGLAVSGGSSFIVGINSDGFILRNKGSLPIINLADRTQAISACRYVDSVDVNPQNGMDQKSILPFIEKHEIKTLVVGSDWLEKDYLTQIGLTGQDLQRLGLSIVFKPYALGISTTKIKQRLLTRSRRGQSGTGTLVVVPCFNPDHLLAKLLDAVPDALLVDNGTSDFSVYEHIGEPEVNSNGPTYEAGAFLHAFENYEYERYCLLQDSIVINDTKFISDPASLFGGQAGAYALSAIRPASVGMTHENYEFIRTTFPEFSDVSLDGITGVQYNAISLSRAQLKAIVDSRLLNSDRLPRNKGGSEAWERIWGLILDKLEIPLHALSDHASPEHSVFSKTFRARK